MVPAVQNVFIWVLAVSLLPIGIGVAILKYRLDRRFNRARYDADRTVAAFAARLQDAVDPYGVRADLLSAVYRSLEPAHLSVWLPPDGSAARGTPRGSRASRASS